MKQILEKTLENKILPKKLDIIWNVTRICGCYCSICRVDAIQVIKRNDQLVLISGIRKEKTEYIPATEEISNIYVDAERELVKKRKRANF